MSSRVFTFLLPLALLSGLSGLEAGAAENVTISFVTANGTFSGGVFTPTAENATVSTADISALLAAGTSVIITTGYTGTQAGTITVSSPIQGQGVVAASLTLVAQSSISLNAAIMLPNGGLTLNAGGAITQNAPLTVSGPTSVSAAYNDVILNNNANDFSVLQIAMANTVSVADANSLTLEGSTVTGNLTVNTFGPLMQVGPLTVSGITTLAAPNNDVVLNNAANDLSVLQIVAANNVSVADANSLALGASTVAGNLTVNTFGPITQSGALIVNGAGETATFAAGPGNNITLNNPLNDFSTLAIASANSVAVSDANSLVLGASSLTGNLTLNTVGSITQIAPLTVAGVTSLLAGNNDVVLNNAANDFSVLQIAAANNVSVRDVNSLALDPSTVAGNLMVNTAGTLSQSGPLMVQGTAWFATGSTGSLQLMNVNNQLSAFSIPSARDATVVSAQPVSLLDCSVQGNLSVTTPGPLTQAGTVAAFGSVSLSASTVGLSGSVNAGLSLDVLGTAALNGDTLLTGNPVVLHQAVTGNGHRLSVSGAANLLGDSLSLAGSIFNFQNAFSIQTDLLSITGWTGSTNGGGPSQLLAGNSAAALATTSLAKVRFINPSGFATGTYRGIALSTGEIVPTPHPALQATNFNSRLVLTWNDTSVLQVATNVAGPYADVPGATSPYTNQNFSLPAAFYRLR